ncbi:MAG: helix-turn-helix domain-containing protein [Propionibacteriaceae bacterium]|nr:helix-turn-helix domain-containing protein [Propionibacteriaceae bacterium]
MSGQAVALRAWWTPEQVAAYYQLPLHSVWRKIRQGEIRAKNLGTPRCPRYRVSAHEIRRLDQLDAA